jgi:hypothetical protein
MKLSLLLVLTGAMFGSWIAPRSGFAETQYEDSLGFEHQFYLRISQPGRVWWHIGPQTTRNIPRPAPSRQPGTAYEVDTDSLYALLLEYNAADDSLVTLILCHPEGDYRTVDSVFSAIDRVSRYFDSVLALGLETTIEDLPDNARHRYRYAMVAWNAFDGRFGAILPNITRQPYLPPKEVAEDDTYAARYESGYWEERKANAIEWVRRKGKVHLPKRRSPDTTGTQGVPENSGNK